MRIIINADSDNIEIIDAISSYVVRVKSPVEHKRILSEIFNSLDISGISLEYISDGELTVEEW